MVDQLAQFTEEVTRVAPEVAPHVDTKGRLVGRAQVRGVFGAWEDLRRTAGPPSNAN
ncbi:hypothetical protein [Streptomyces sp. NPDC004685]